jgi:hypothetical protein
MIGVKVNFLASNTPAVCEITAGYSWLQLQSPRGPPLEGDRQPNYELVEENRRRNPQERLNRTPIRNASM